MVITLGQPLATAYRYWRYRIFGVMWLLYAGYYLCRKNYAVAQPVIMEEFGWDQQDAGIIITSYLTMYAIGQFISGPLGDKVGARRIITCGICLSVAMNLYFSFSNSILMMAIIMAANGLAQSTGWPGAIKTMSNWFPIDNRGRMMAWWGTNYQAGDLVSTALAAFIIGFASWQTAFWISALVLAGVGAVFLWGQRNHPEDVGLPNLTEIAKIQSTGTEENTAPLSGEEHSFSEILKEIIWNKHILNLGASYFLLKLVRYTLLFWLSTYLVNVIGYRPDKAGYMSAIFPLAGFMGTVAAGYASDKLFSARRGPISVIMLLLLVVSLYCYNLFAADPLIGPIVLACIGFMTFGPDTLISATSAMDFGSQRYASTAAGFINGLGSIGAALSGVLVGWISTVWGWEAVFYFLMAIAFACACLQMFMWNARGVN